MIFLKNCTQMYFKSLLFLVLSFNWFSSSFGFFKRPEAARQTRRACINWLHCARRNAQILTLLLLPNDRLTYSQNTYIPMTWPHSDDTFPSTWHTYIHRHHEGCHREQPWPGKRHFRECCRHCKGCLGLQIPSYRQMLMSTEMIGIMVKIIVLWICWARDPGGQQNHGRNIF